MHLSDELKIIPIELLEQYKSAFDTSIQDKFDKLQDSELSIDIFSFYISVSAVYSSKIEGEDIELDSFIKHKRLGAFYQLDYTRKIDDLYEAFVYAQQNKLSATTLESVHALLTKHILQESQRGKFRKGNMYVLSEDGKIEYVAATPDKVNTEMGKLYADIDILLKTEMSFDEVFFFASTLHLVFVKIHPFEDGNGRAARLLEKWFLAEKLGEKVWFLQSERHYYEQHKTYYNNIRRLGLEYEELNCQNALPFLQMLPGSVDL